MNPPRYYYNNDDSAVRDEFRGQYYIIDSEVASGNIVAICFNIEQAAQLVRSLNARENLLEILGA